MMKKYVVSSLMLVSVFVMQLSANPVDSVTMTNTGFGAKDTMTIWGGGHSGLTVYSGIFMFNKTASTGTGNLISNGTIGGFCMDLSEYLASGPQTYEVLNVSEGPKPTTFLGGGMGATKAAYLSELWGRYFDSSWMAGGTYTAAQNAQAEVFQAAIWEIIYEDLPTSSAGWDVTIDSTTGNKGFIAANLDYTLANSWLGSLTGMYQGANLTALSYNGNQDILTVIPEPATVAFLAAGLLLAVSRGYKTLNR
ncbi:MAG: hypothetical protein WC770_08495 [Phycisphaerae bacterium]|jgi:hypothetical protein